MNEKRLEKYDRELNLGVHRDTATFTARLMKQLARETFTVPLAPPAK